MNRPQNLIEPESVLHGCDILGDNVTCMVSDNRYAKNLIFPWNRQNFYEAMRLFFRYGSIQIVNFIGRDFIRNVLFFCLKLIQYRSSENPAL